MLSWFRGEEKPKADPSEFHIPEFYRGADGPLIKVLETRDDYEIRLYDKTQWVSSHSPPGEFMSAFWRLYSYIGGKNDQGKKMDMNMPVRMHVKLSEDDVDGTKVEEFIVSFFLSSSLLPNLPQPVDEKVFLEQEDSRVTFVAHFSGMAKEKDWKDSRCRLMQALDRDGKGYARREYFSAGYDPPYKLWNRRNEMILLAEDKAEELAEEVEETKDNNTKDAEPHQATTQGNGEEKPKHDVTEFHQPEFYHGSQGPNFKVLTSDSNDDYETRIYQPTKWITSKMEVKDYEEGSSKSFWQLFNYIGGKNETKSKVAMTCPVRSTVEIEQEQVKSARMSFFVDPTKDCPAPTEEGLFFEEEGEKKFYVSNFGGFAKYQLYTEHLKKLKAALDRDGKSYITNTYYTAGHDPPFRLWGRRNEVYVEAKDE